MHLLGESPAIRSLRDEIADAARSDAMTRSSAVDGRFRISTLADFDGAEVAPDAAAVDRCTHR